MKTNTKYIKVSVSERQPEKEGRYFLWVDNPNARNLNSQKLSAEYNMERHFFKNGEFQTFYDTTHCLQEVPDYEDEMKEMLEAVLKTNKIFNFNGYRINNKIEELLTKLKTES